MWGYQSRLRRDLDRWRAEGWVTTEGDARIRAELAQRQTGFGLSGALAVLGAVLLGFAAMSFVAANWQEMSKLARLLLLFTSIVAAYGAAGALFVRRLDGFGHAALLLGVSLFGASIMLIAQMYHMDGNPPDAVLTWAGGALLTGVALNSNPALGAALLLAGLWSGWETALTTEVHWLFVPAWLLIAMAMFRQRWRSGLMLAGLALSIWVVALGYLLNKGHAHELVVLLGLLACAAGWAIQRAAIPRGPSGIPAAWLAYVEPATLIGFGMSIAFAGALAVQFAERVSVGHLILLAMLTLAALLAAIYWGFRNGYRSILWLGYAGFSIEVLALYFRTIGTLMGSSLFFLVTGLLVIGLAAAAWRLHERHDLASLEETAGGRA